VNRSLTRRCFLSRSAGGLGGLALANLEAAPHFPAKAKSVIFLFMEGAPSQLDLFDPKPAMAKYDGQPLPESMTKDLRFAFIKPTAKIWASTRPFRAYGQSGIEFSDLLPHLAARADDLCVIRSLHTDQFNHHPAQLMMVCGSQLVGRPSMGSWILYGLGSESHNLPGFVVLGSGRGATAGAQLFASGFLPPVYQGTAFRSTGDAVLHLKNPAGMTPERQRARLDAIRDLNQRHYDELADPEIAARIESYELAFRMQAAAPELLDLSKESDATKTAYGLDNDDTRAFGSNCLLARRMVERGVRFIQLTHGSWDDHNFLNRNLAKNCRMTDQPAAALLADLKQRGLLDSTLVVWAGEFGRTPFVEDNRPGDDSRGRDHHPSAFTIWMAGGGVKPGQTIGKTDDLCLAPVEDKVHIHDLHATILHLLGLDHKKLTYRYQGRDFRLTDVAGNVVRKALT